MQVRKQQLELDMEQQTGQIGKGVRQGCILSLCLFNFYAEYIMRNAGLEEARAGIKIAGRNINNLRYADDTTLMAESEEELKSHWRASSALLRASATKGRSPMHFQSAQIWGPRSLVGYSPWGCKELDTTE